MTTTSKAKTPADTKIGSVIELLRRKNGATLDQLVKETGWQKHTVRAALTGLKKKGYTITREKRDGNSTYSITEPAS